MTITKLEPIGTKKIRVYIDDERYCLLYTNEVWRLSLREDLEISDSKLEELNQKLLYRSKMKVMALLKHSNRTKYELIQKLKRLEFPEFVIDDAIAYVEGYHYIDDDAYVRNYISYYSQSRSKNRMKFDLRKKGIKDDKFQRIWEEFDVPEKEVLEEQVAKRLRIKGMITRENYQKHFNFFLRKGFQAGDVSKVLKEYLESEY